MLLVGELLLLAGRVGDESLMMRRQWSERRMGTHTRLSRLDSKNPHEGIPMRGHQGPLRVTG